MSTTDIVLLLPLAYGAFNGYKRGLLVEVFGILALIVAIVFGFRFLGIGVDFLADAMGSSTFGNLLPYLSFILIFFPSVYFINKLGWAFRKALRVTFLGTLDGFGGALLGAILWAFGLSTLIWLAGAVGFSLPPEKIGQSVIYPYLDGFAPKMIHKIGEIAPSASEILDKFKELKDKSMSPQN